MALQNFSVKTGRRVSGHLEDGLGEPLLIDAKPGQDDDGEDNDDNDDDPEESHRPATSLAAAYRLLTPSVKVPYSAIFFRFFACNNALYYHGCTVRLLLLTVSSALALHLFSETSQVQLLIYFMLKFAMEILLSESSVVTTFYFKWTTSNVAIFLAVLGLTVLPVNVIVGSYVTNLFQDRYVMFVAHLL
jgi:hypothetical protein